MTKFNKLKAGEVLSESQHYTVKRINRDTVVLQPDQGEEIQVNAAYAENMLTSGEQFSKEEKIGKTEIAALLLANPYVALTVNYNKQVKAEDIEKEILVAYENASPREFKDAVTKAVKHTLNGELRTMSGFHYGKMDELGRLQFIDMKVERDPRKEYDTRQRLVDTRQIHYLILRDTKYTVK